MRLITDLMKVSESGFLPIYESWIICLMFSLIESLFRETSYYDRPFVAIFKNKYSIFKTDIQYLKT